MSGGLLEWGVVNIVLTAITALLAWELGLGPGRREVPVAPQAEALGWGSGVCGGSILGKPPASQGAMPRSKHAVRGGFSLPGARLGPGDRGTPRLLSPT